MSISSEISRISQNVADSLEQVALKGVTVPAGSNSDDLPGLIAQITGGGGSANVGIINVADYGAVGDGVTDDSQAIQDACDAGYDIYFESNKTYYIASTVTVDHDVRLHGGENTVIKTKTPSGGTVNNGIVVQGTLKKTTTLTSSYVSSGTTEANCNNKFTLTDMSGIAIGDIMVITAEDQYYNYARQYYYLGATLLITDIYDGHIYSCDTMPFDITNSEDVSVDIYDAPAVIIENLNFVSDLDSIGAYRYLVSLECCKNSIVRNCDFTQMANGIHIKNCVNTKIEDVSLSKSKYDNSLNGDGYGIICASSTNMIFDRIMATCAQHAISLSGTIPLINTYIRNCKLTSECRAPGLDTHESVYNTVIEDCVLGTAALNGTVFMNRCKIINNRRFSTSSQNISIYGSHNPAFSSIRISNTAFEDVGIIALPATPQDPIQAYDNVFGSIEIENCTGGSFSYDPSTTATILSNTINKLSITNWTDCKEIYHTGTGKIIDLAIKDSSFTNKFIINDHNNAHGVVLTNIEYFDFSDINPLAHKVHLGRATYGENVVLPKNVSISLSSNNASAKFVVCGANLVSDNISDYVVGSVTGSAGGTLSRTAATGNNIPSISFNSSGNLVYSQNSGTTKYSVYPVGMFYVKEPSNVAMSATLVNSGSTDGAKFAPMIAIVDCETGQLVDRYSGTGQTATAQGVSISYNKQVGSGFVVMCYYVCSTAVSGSETTFEDYTVTCSPNLIPAVIDQPYTAHRLTGDGTILSLDGVNNIMSSELSFNVSFNADYANNPIGLLPSGSGVSF